MDKILNKKKAARHNQKLHAKAATHVLSNAEGRKVFKILFALLCALEVKSFLSFNKFLFPLFFFNRLFFFSF